MTYNQYDRVVKNLYLKQQQKKEILLHICFTTVFVLSLIWKEKKQSSLI